MQVMITLNCDVSLYNSGENKSFDYAVIYTDKEEYGLGIKDFDTPAYATAYSNDLGAFNYFTKEDVSK